MIAMVKIPELPHPNLKFLGLIAARNEREAIEQAVDKFDLFRDQIELNKLRLPMGVFSVSRITEEDGEQGLEFLDLFLAENASQAIDAASKQFDIPPDQLFADLVSRSFGIWEVYVKVDVVPPKVQRFTQPEKVPEGEIVPTPPTPPPPAEEKPPEEAPPTPPEEGLTDEEKQQLQQVEQDLSDLRDAWQDALVRADQSLDNEDFDSAERWLDTAETTRRSFISVLNENSSLLTKANRLGEWNRIKQGLIDQTQVLRNRLERERQKPTAKLSFTIPEFKENKFAIRAKNNSNVSVEKDIFITVMDGNQDGKTFSKTIRNIVSAPGSETEIVVNFDGNVDSGDTLILVSDERSGFKDFREEDFSGYTIFKVKGLRINSISEFGILFSSAAGLFSKANSLPASQTFDYSIIAGKPTEEKPPEEEKPPVEERPSATIEEPQRMDNYINVVITNTSATRQTFWFGATLRKTGTNEVIPLPSEEVPLNAGQWVRHRIDLPVDQMEKNIAYDLRISVWDTEPKKGVGEEHRIADTGWLTAFITLV